jgi:hypothetical protein
VLELKLGFIEVEMYELAQETEDLIKEININNLISETQNIEI